MSFVPRPEIALLTKRLYTGNMQMTNGNGVPTDAVTGAGTLKIGGLYTNTATNIVYINVGTKASPRYLPINK